MTIDFYATPVSGPCRAVQVVAEHLGISLNFKPLDLMKGEHLTPEFLAINPQHTVPTIVDNGLVLWESRPILEYLAQKYGHGKLYPRDVEKRALVSQRLYFDMGTLNQRWYDYWMPQWMKKEAADPEKQKKIEEALGFLNTFLNGHDWVAGDELTIADISIAVTVSNMVAMGQDLGAYKSVKSWFLRVQRVPGYEKNAEGVELLRQL